MIAGIYICILYMHIYIIYIYIYINIVYISKEKTELFNRCLIFILIGAYKIWYIKSCMWKELQKNWIVKNGYLQMLKKTLLENNKNCNKDKL